MERRRHGETERWRDGEIERHIHIHRQKPILVIKAEKKERRKKWIYFCFENRNGIVKKKKVLIEY